MGRACLALAVRAASARNREILRWRRYIYADDVKGGRTDKTVTRHSGQWKKGQSGNPAGPPKGTRHKATIAAEALLDGEVEALTRKAIERALEGDGVALRLCLWLNVRYERKGRMFSGWVYERYIAQE
jgi:hypothetical protein